MKTKMFKAVVTLAIGFSTLSASSLSAHHSGHHSSSSITQSNSNQSSIYQSIALWHQQTRYLHDAVVAITTGVPAATLTAELAEINAAVVKNSLSIATYLTQYETNQAVLNNLDFLLNQFVVVGEQYASAVVANPPNGASSAAGQAVYNNWMQIGVNLSEALTGLNAYVDATTIQNAITQYITLEVEQINNYAAANYAVGLQFNDQALIQSGNIGAYLAQAGLIQNQYASLGINPAFNLGPFGFFPTIGN